MLTFVRKLTSLGTVLFAVQQFTLAGHAHAAPCKRLCTPAILRCAAAGNRRARCRRQLLRLCKASGAAACDGAYPTTTTTTLAPSYVGTWVFSGALDTNDCGATGVDATFTSGLLTLAVSGDTLSGTLADVAPTGPVSLHGTLQSDGSFFAETVDFPPILSGCIRTAVEVHGGPLGASTDVIPGRFLNVTTCDEPDECDVGYAGTWKRE